MLKKNRNYVNLWYDSSNFQSLRKVKATSSVAVIIHLYYTDMTEVFSEMISRMSDVDYDLFITIPENKYDHTLNDVSQHFPGAHIVPVPNCGRDVLPFIEVMKCIGDSGYDKVLKVHSKKSPHRKDGDSWRNEIINSLTPAFENSSRIGGILGKLSHAENAIIGPKGQYLSLLVNFDSTRHHTRKLLSRIYSKKIADDFMGDIVEYGFFAGTMFWARIDAVKMIIDNVERGDFEPELGQEDSTFAHSLERLFCVVTEIEGKLIYASGPGGLEEQKYFSPEVPIWAMEHPDYKSEDARNEC